METSNSLPYTLANESFDSYFSHFVPGRTKTYSWNQLVQIERTRRETKDRVELPLSKILRFWDGTIIVALTKDSMIWLTMVIFIGIRIHSRLAMTDDGNVETPNYVTLLADSNLDILGGFLSFLLVLFVNQANERFFQMYLLSKASAGRIQDIAGLAISNMSPTATHRLVRYMNAAHIAGYVGLGGPYKKQNFFDHFNEKHKLLTRAEMGRLNVLEMENGSKNFKELCTWCEKEVTRAQRAGSIDDFQATLMHSKILDLRASMDGIYDYCDQPTHFFYIHFLCVLTILYLPQFAINNGYKAGWANESDVFIEILNGFMTLLQAIFVVGLRSLGQTLIYPFGTDVEDLSVITYVETTIENSFIITTSEQGGNLDDDLETTFMKEVKEALDGNDDKINPKLVASV